MQTIKKKSLFAHETDMLFATVRFNQLAANRFLVFGIWILIDYEIYYEARAAILIIAILFLSAFFFTFTSIFVCVLPDTIRVVANFVVRRFFRFVSVLSSVVVSCVVVTLEIEITLANERQLIAIRQQYKLQSKNTDTKRTQAHAHTAE